MSIFYNRSKGNAEKRTWDYNSNSGYHDKINDSLSNVFDNLYTYSGAGINFRTQNKKWTYSYGAMVQKATMNSLLNKGNEISQVFTDVLPAANLTYKFNNFSNVRIDYTTSTQQPVADVSDPINIREGNPALRREYIHSLNLNYFQGDPATRKNLFMFVAINRVRSAIVNSDKIDPLTGVRTTKPVNVNGTWSLFSDIDFGFPIRRLKSRLEMGTSVSFFNNVGILNDEKNIIRNLSVAPNLGWSFEIENKVEIHATARLGYNKASYSLQKELNTNYWQQTYGIEMNNYLPWGFVVNNDFTYTRNTGRAEGYNTSVPLWNVSVSKMFLKNKRGEIKLSAFDLLSKNIGNMRNSNTNYIEDTRYNVMQRYFLLGFTYSGLKGGPRAVIRTIAQ